MDTNRRLALGALLMASAAAPPLTRALAQAGQRPRPGDYLPAELRQRVEALRRDVAATPTGDGNFKARSLTLYEWANAYALTGRAIHSDLTSAVAGMQAPTFPNTGDRARRASFDYLDQMVRTLGALDDDPLAMGRLSSSTSGAFEADGYATFQQTYHVGTAPIRPGGGVFCPNHFYFTWGEYQGADPAADNYLTIRASNPGVRFETSTRDLNGMFSARLGALTPRVFFRLTAGELGPGDTVTVTFGDRSGGSKGVRLVPWSNTALRFPMWILTEADGLLFAPREQAFPIVGGRAAGVRGFAPSVVALGERFDISVRTEDAARNLATGGAPGFRLMLDGKQVRKIARSAKAITVVTGLTLTTPGPHRFTVESDDGALKGEVNPILAEANPTERVFWGETHGHCGFSEGMGQVDAYFRFALEESRLDFICLSEHDLWMDSWEWGQMRRAVKAFEQPGKFATYMGYEWTVDAALGGHHNVIFRDVDGVTPVSRIDHPTIRDLHRGLRRDYDAKDVLVIPHAHMTGDWTISDGGLASLVEIVSEHGTFEWLGQKYLAQGHMVGMIGASDNHIGHPGYKSRPKGGGYTFDGWGGLAAVTAPRHDRNDIFDALKDRRAYATNQERIILRTTLNGGRMGVIAPSAASRTIAGVVHGTGAIESITLVKNGEDHETLAYDRPAAPDAPALVEVRFHSSSFVGHRIPSRSARIWEGTVRVEGARITGLASPQSETLNRLTEFLRVDPTDPSLAHFRLSTRGHAKALRLTVDAPLDQVKVTIDVPSSRIPLRVTLPVPRAGGEPVTIKALDRDPGSERQGAGSFDDTIAVRRITPAAERDRTFSFVDAAETRDGDYYYVRVIQADGGMAWSSPVWVGALPKRTRA